MLKTSCRSWFSVLVGIGALVGGEPNTLASPISATIGYDTTGSIGPSRVGGVPVVSFQGVSDGSFVTSTPFILGTFQVSPSASGTVSVPFTITYHTDTIDGFAPTINDTPIVLQGQIVGTVGEGGQSSLMAIFAQGPQPADPAYYSPHPASPFQTGDMINTIGLNGGLEDLVLSTTGAGSTSVEGQIDAVSVPEPTPLALFAVVGASFAIRRWIRHFGRPRTGGRMRRVD